MQAQLEAVLRGIEERTPHSEVCKGGCYCDKPARVRAEQARTVERLGNALFDYGFDRLAPSEAWAAALRAGEEHQ